MTVLEGKNILITGGTGSFGQAFIKWILINDNPARVVVYSRDEFKQYEMNRAFHNHLGKLRFFIGDVRDEKRLRRALEGVDIVVHAAALKHVPSCEYNPLEAVYTNILGTGNVITACIEAGVKRVVYLSTDKACMPINLYGGTKLVGEKLVTQANYYAPIFNVVRYGNVIGARGGVIDLFREKIAQRAFQLPITHKKMTRFWVSYQQAISAVYYAIKAQVGTVHIMKAPSIRIVDFAKAFHTNVTLEEVGLRPGEKLHEILVHEYEAPRTWEKQDSFIVLPEHIFDEKIDYTKDIAKAKRVLPNFIYRSDTNNDWLDRKTIRRMLKDGTRKTG